jgi:glycosyltransferase involved in cell wall biosynthesis
VETVFLFGHKGGCPDRMEGCEHYYLRHIQFMTRKHPVVNLLLFLCFLPLNVVRIRRLIKSKSIDIVDIDGIANTLPAMAARLSRVPILWYFNDPYLPAPVRRLILPWVTRLSARVVVQGECFKSSQTSLYPRLRDKTVVLYPGVDLDRFNPDRVDASVREGLRQQWGIPPDCTLVGTIGNLNQVKGHIHFIEAARQIKQQSPRTRFLVVGRRLDSAPGYWELLQELTTRLGLTHDIVYVDFQEDVPAVLKTLGIFVLPSLLESCPNAVLEAMAMKVPVVATDVGAVAELLDEGRMGTLVPPGDATAIAGAVLACLERSAGEIKIVTDAARKRVETQFGLDKIARLQLQVYETLMRQ